MFIGHTAQCGGGELALLNLIANLDQERFEASVLLFADGPLRERLEEYVPVIIEPLEARILSAHKEALVRGAGRSDIAGLCTFVWRVRDVIRRTKPELIHTNSLKADLIGGVAARLAGVPVIWHVRDRIANDYLPAPVVKVFRSLARVMPRHIIANSFATRDTLCGSGRCMGDKDQVGRGFRSKMSVVHDGVATVPRGGHLRSCQQIVVGLVGRISPWKGQDVFLRAAAIVRVSHPGVVFRIIGSPLFGEDEYARSLHRLCADLMLKDEVEFTGFVSDIHPAIDDLDILVHASTLPEPFGQVIIEGMAAGKPVVATNGGGVPEIVVDGETGFLVPMKDDQQMAEAICRLVERPELRARMGDRGRRRVEENFRIEITAEKVQGIFDDVLEEIDNGSRRSKVLDLFSGLRASERKTT